MKPETLSSAIASAEKNHAALVSRAASLAGKPLEHDAWILVGAAQRITNNLRALLNTVERRNP